MQGPKDPHSREQNRQNIQMMTRDPQEGKTPLKVHAGGHISLLALVTSKQIPRQPDIVTGKISKHEFPVEGASVAKAPRLSQSWFRNGNDDSELSQS